MTGVVPRSIFGQPAIFNTWCEALSEVNCLMQLRWENSSGLPDLKFRCSCDNISVKYDESDVVAKEVFKVIYDL